MRAIVSAAYHAPRAVIRPAVHDEIERLREIEDDAGLAFAGIGMPEISSHDAPSAAALAPFIDDGRACVAVDDDDRPIAYLVWSVVDGFAFIEQVSVARSHARRGVGRELIDQLEATTRRPLLLTTFRDVPWNAPYYRRLGFEVVEPADHGPELAALIARETAAIPSDAPRVAMSRT
jgi:GNAT superfamily N-acetyltransferase